MQNAKFLAVVVALTCTFACATNKNTAKPEDKPKHLEVTRTFDAPRFMVWKTWTESSQIKKWWGPKNYTAPTIKNDLRVGGKYLFAMKGPDKKTYWSTGTYKEIVPQTKIVATDSFSDEKGNVVFASELGLPYEFPAELEVTTTFEEVDGKTKLTIRQIGVPAEAIESTQVGWNESLDKFETALKSKKKLK